MATVVSNLLDNSKIDSFMDNQDVSYVFIHVHHYTQWECVHISLQPTGEGVTSAEKLLNNIERLSDNIASVFNDKLISTKKLEMKRDNFSKTIWTMMSTIY